METYKVAVSQCPGKCIMQYIKTPSESHEIIYNGTHAFTRAPALAGGFANRSHTTHVACILKYELKCPLAGSARPDTTSQSEIVGTLSVSSSRCGDA